MDEEGIKVKTQLSPRVSFILGILGAVALFSIIGFGIILKLYLGSNRGAGSRGAAGESVTKGQAPESAGAQVPGVKEGEHTRGNKDAQVTVIEYSDLECPFCKSFHPTMLRVIREYPQKVRWVYRHFPLDSIHPNARKEAEASECAGEQGKFWEFADKIFERTKSNGFGFALEDLPKLARELGLDGKKFDECFNVGKYASKVEDDFQGGVRAGVRGTPGNFINGIEVPGALPFEQLKKIIDGELGKG